MFKKINKHMKKKREIDGKIKLHSPCIVCGFKKLKN